MLAIGAQYHVLSTRIEAARLGHLVSELALGAEVPHQAGDAQNDNSEDGCVLLPVGWLCIPATSRRPDVLRVSIS